MSTITVETQLTHRSLMGMMKDELAELVLSYADTNARLTKVVEPAVKVGMLNWSDGLEQIRPMTECGRMAFRDLEDAIAHYKGMHSVPWSEDKP